jgi:drug/metabolite transporter (DMT)-like permease
MTIVHGLPPFGRNRYFFSGNQPFLACITLLIAALLWGSGNLANKTILYDIDPVCAVFLRSSIAALALLWPAWCEQAGAFPNGWVRSSLPGSTVFALALFFQ